MLKKIIAGVLAVGMLSSVGAVTAFADVTDTQVVNYDSSVNDSASTIQTVGVDLERAELYSVTLPKTIVMDGTNSDKSEFEYNIAVTGEISNQHYVRVIPMDGAKLTLDDESVAMDLNVAQAKRRWDATEVAASATTTGTMTVTDIMPGVWHGNVTFLVTLDDGGRWNAATCTSPATCTGYDSNDNGVIDTEEELSVPVTKGKALGHKFADNDDSFPIECERCGKMIYAIRTPAQLTAFKDNVNAGNKYNGATIELCNDINMTGITWQDGIGRYKTVSGSINTRYFGGTFNGNGYTISNLKIDNSTETDTANTSIGLFGVVSGATIKNLSVVDMKVTDTKGATSIGGLIGEVGSNDSNVISNNVLKNVTVYSTTNAVLNTAVVIAKNSGNTIVQNNAVIGAISLTANKNNSCIGGVLGTPNYSGTKIQIKNNYIAVEMSVAAGTCRSIYGDAVGIAQTVNNVVNTGVGDYTIGYSASATAATKLTDDACKTQAAIDVLNTDNSGVWKLDLENLNDGYPVLA